MMDVSFLENLEQRFYEGEHSRLLGRIRKRQDQERTGRSSATLLYLWEPSFCSSCVIQYLVGQSPPPQLVSKHL